jgi:hypothetical protein
LVVNLHNSQRSYNSAVGNLKDIAGSGVYLADRNEIHVWSDEKEDTRIEMRVLLREYAEQLAEGGSEIAARGDELDLVRMAASGPRDRVSTVLSHELTHWVVHASLSEVATTAGSLPPAFYEGLALIFDAESRRYFLALRRDLGVNDDEPNETPAHPQADLDWPCIWFKATEHKAASPAALVSLTDRDFYDRGAIRQNYADSWALVYLFGKSILSDALNQSRPVAEVIREDPDFSTPWAQIKDDIQFKRNVPEYLLHRFDDYR